MPEPLMGQGSLCGIGVGHSVGAYFDAGEQALLLRVVSDPIEASLGARLSGFRVDEELVVSRLDTIAGLEPLGLRYKDHVRLQWPQTYRFQAPRRAWQVGVVCGTVLDRHEQVCVLQMAARPQERTLKHVSLDMQDAKDAASYAARFCQHVQQRGMEDGTALADFLPPVQVAAPVACEVVASHYPSLIPVGSICTLWPYSASEVTKFVFTGSDDFLELPQAYFHYAAFASNGKQLVWDLQGYEEDDGTVVLVDPCVLRTEPAQVAHVVGAAVPVLASAKAAVLGDGPTPEHFDRLHPRCAPLCQTFDAQRKSVRRNVGVCGVTCGIGR